MCLIIYGLDHFVVIDVTSVDISWHEMALQLLHLSHWLPIKFAVENIHTHTARERGWDNRGQTHWVKRVVSSPKAPLPPFLIRPFLLKKVKRSFRSTIVLLGTVRVNEI